MEISLEPRVVTVLSGALFALLFAGCERSTSAPSAEEEARRIYAMTCARCHGADGKGAPGFLGKAPTNLSDPAFQRARSDAEIERVITHGKGAMPAFGKMYRAEDISALVGVVRGLNAEKK